MPVTSFASFRLIENLYSLEDTLLMAGYDHLGNTLSVVHDKVFLRQIDKQYTHLSTIIGIHRSGRVQYGHPLLQSQSTTRSDLSLIPLGQGDMQSRRDKSALHGLQQDRCFEIGPQIHPRTLLCSVLRQGLMTFVHDFDT